MLSRRSSCRSSHQWRHHSSHHSRCSATPAADRAAAPADNCAASAAASADDCAASPADDLEPPLESPLGQSIEQLEVDNDDDDDCSSLDSSTWEEHASLPGLRRLPKQGKRAARGAVDAAAVCSGTRARRSQPPQSASDVAASPAPAGVPVNERPHLDLVLAVDLARAVGRVLTSRGSRCSPSSSKAAIWRSSLTSWAP
eukprot:6183690-Pleurochrysis_carterae.AAC.4